MITTIKSKYFLFKEETDVLGWALGIIIGTSLGYLLFLTINAMLVLRK